jgi:hypothetical protein
MLTRSDIAADYQINEAGTIVSPGKFEGEPYYAVGLYDLVLEGCTDESNGAADLITVDADLRTAYPEIPVDVTAFVVWTSDVGFFNVSEYADLAAANIALADIGGDDDGDDVARDW